MVRKAFGGGGAGGHPAQAPNQLVGVKGQPTLQLPSTIDVLFARFTGCPVYNGLLVLVVEALPLGMQFSSHLLGLR